MTQDEALPELIIVLGKTGVGKSTFIRAATGLDVEVGDRIKSCTAEVQIYPISDSRMFLIDTPGFDDPAQTDTGVLQSIASCLADMYEGLTFPDLEVILSGAIYIQSINERRMTRPMKNNLQMLNSLVGEHNMEHCVLVSSKWRLEDSGVAQRNESELVQNADYWGSLLEAGAKIARFQDTQRSALEIIELSKCAGVFIPQLTQEYVIQEKELNKTAVGRAIDEDIAKARECHEKDLERWGKEHRQALEDTDAKARVELEALSLQAEMKLKSIADETERLRATRNAAQIQMDWLEKPTLRSDYGDNRSILQADHDKHRARQKRAFRWFGRFAAMGAAVTMSVLTSGAMTPVGIALIGTVETVCQMDKDREAAKN